MPTVELDSQFTVYADIDEADAYLDGASHAADWRAITDDDVKARALVTATRILDRQTWLDEYDTFELRVAEENIVNAAIELALALTQNAEVQTQQSTARQIRSLSAGSVSITYASGVTVATRFPQIVTELLRDYVGGDADSLYAKAEGVDGETIFPLDLGFTGGL